MYVTVKVERELKDQVINGDVDVARIGNKPTRHAHVPARTVHKIMACMVHVTHVHVFIIQGMHFELSWAQLRRGLRLCSRRRRLPRCYRHYRAPASAGGGAGGAVSVGVHGPSVGTRTHASLPC